MKWFNPAKGFGFIQRDKGDVDVFVHVSGVEPADLPGLRDGQAVTYELERDRRSGKISATNLRLRAAGRTGQGRPGRLGSRWPVLGRAFRRDPGPMTR